MPRPRLTSYSVFRSPFAIHVTGCLKPDLLSLSFLILSSFFSSYPHIIPAVRVRGRIIASVIYFPVAQVTRQSVMQSPVLVALLSLLALLCLVHAAPVQPERNEREPQLRQVR